MKDRSLRYADVDAATDQLLDIWGFDWEQVEAHLENEDFTDDEIDHALDRIEEMEWEAEMRAEAALDARVANHDLAVASRIEAEENERTEREDCVW